MASVSVGLTRMQLPLSLVPIIVLSIGFALAAQPSPDILALLEFKKGIRRDPLGYVLSSWNRSSLESNGCPSTWHGIQCSGGLITGIFLDSLSLAGDIRLGSLGGLAMLANLSLSNNSLSGELEAELGAMRSLQHMDISNNRFYGQIPDSLTSLQSLVHLNLSLNHLTGRIPKGLERLKELRKLDMHSNRLSGPIDSGLMLLEYLEHVDFGSNMLSGSLPLKLTVEASIASPLVYVNLSNNRLTGHLPYDGVPLSFDNLKVLDISNNRLTGQLPSFPFLYALEVLRLGNNRFSGSLPSTLLKQDSSSLLTELDLSRNNLSGPLPMITSTTLKILNLSLNELSGTLPIKVGSCAVVDLSNNKFSGNLSVLQTWGNAIELLDLSYNLFTGGLPDNTSQFLRLAYINLSHNAFVGPLPPLLGIYPKLSVIDLSFNHLSGSLLASLFTSSTLAHLHLSNNYFTGGVPLDEIQPVSPSSALVTSPLVQYSRLESLDLSNNQLNGSVPSEIGAIATLRKLNLARNQFSGNIPSEISKLLALVDLDLSLNHFRGKLPTNLPISLKSFNVSYNELSGIVPLNLRKFPDSSFHPGNVELIFPHVPSSSGNMDFRRHGNHMKSVVKAAIIGGCTAGAAFLVGLALFFYYKRASNLQDFGRHRGFDDKIIGSVANREKVSNAGYFGFHKDLEDASPVSLSFSVDQLAASEKRPVAQCRTLTSQATVQGIPVMKIEDSDSGKTSCADVSPSKNRQRSSPGSNSHFSSSPQSEDSVTPERSVILKVRSPDRLAGDLFFLDSTLVFTAEELSRAPAEVLGRSSHGTSYKATLDNGHVLTVKWLREGLAKCKKEFTKEAKKFGNIRHPNVISLRGYYWGPREHEKLILSDYVSTQSLAAHLYEGSGCIMSPLSWTQRLKIVVDIARGLNYLHYDRYLPHGNLKATNVLLDGTELNGRLADYGLHRLMTSAGTAEQILNAGALGYRAPELASAKKPRPSYKADVYAFGVILMEILTGKSAGDIISGNSGAVDLTDWVRVVASEGRAVECFDSVLLNPNGEQEPPRGMDDLLAIALKCIYPVSERPSIRTVFEDLSAIMV